MTTKSKSQSLSARRCAPRTRSKTLQESNPSPRTFSKAVLPVPNSSPHTPFSLGAITPIKILKSVTLSEWWLTKRGKEKALCISGFESKGSSVRKFSSGTISKRHDGTTLETIDGITVSMSGFINRTRTLQNGVSSEVCNRFLLGFPYNWKDYNGEELEEEDKKDVHTDFSISFDDIPVSRLQDLSFVEGCVKSKILVDVVGSLRDLVCPKSDKECKKARMVVDDDEYDEKLVAKVVGVKTRGMRRREDYDEASIGKRVHTMSKRKKEIMTQRYISF